MAISTRIREATLADLPILFQMEQGIIEAERPFDVHIKRKDVSYYDLPALINGSDTYLVVLESGEDIIGTGYAQVRESRSFHVHAEHCYLGFIYLRPEFRGKGLGQEILKNLKQWGLQKGLKHFQLGVYVQNEGAIRLYEKAGFKQISIMMETVN